MKEKLKMLLGALGIIALGIAGSVFFSRWFGTVEVERQSAETIKLGTGETQVDAQTYVSLQHGFSMRLPPGYSLIESATGADIVPESGGAPVMTIAVAQTAPKKTKPGAVLYTDGTRFFILSPAGPTPWPQFQETAQSFKAVIESK